MHIKVNIRLLNENGEPFMGNGPFWLLENIKEVKSISQAAQKMKMSYAKGHRILRRLERNLRKKILITTMGGAERGGAELTPFAEEFCVRYEQLIKKIDHFAEKEYLKFQDSLRRGERK